VHGKVTVRGLLRLRRENCISPLGHSGGELRMAVSLRRRFNGEETRGEGRKKRTSEDFDRVAVQHDMRKEMEKERK
jgi:hypothetical protein